MKKQHKMNDPYEKLSVKLPPSDINWLTEISERAGKSRSATVRTLVAIGRSRSETVIRMCRRDAAKPGRPIHDED